ncbi:hypothetical protein [Erythrobacter sp. SD-21]|uniref:hypothetical protein n=1 Tax=Erythrobacter sp. SD-21 TaxID=161528 RepID=UPI000153FC10|nr:hypothetical protein [Erythrobacter sp. SD-21]EDL49429.1 hypothetical protein ED21_17562 [Erythrobacter sp. SD-21]
MSMGPTEFLERLDHLLKATDETAELSSITQLPEFYSGSVPWAEQKRKLFDLPRTALMLELEEVKSDQVDRTATFLSGPFFTSKEFPWPHSGEYSWEPIIQIDLARAYITELPDIGSGLLQVWKCNPSDFDSYETRYVPAEAVSTENITPIPDKLLCHPETTHARRAKSGEAPWTTTALLAVEEEEVVSIHDELESYLASLADDWEGPELLVKEADRLRDACADLSVVDGDYFLGNYYPRGYDASLDLLLAQISDQHFYWGDDGKGILLLPDRGDLSSAEFVWFS